LARSPRNPALAYPVVRSRRETTWGIGSPHRVREAGGFRTSGRQRANEAGNGKGKREYVEFNLLTPFHIREIHIMKAAACVLALVLGCLASSAPAEMIDDFSGDLSAYTKTVILTNSGDTEEVSMAKTNFVINADQLEFHSYVTNNKAYQTVLLRDDHPLAVGERLQIDFKYFNDITATTSPFSGVGIAVAASEAQTFNVRRDIIMVDLNGAYGNGTTTTGRVYGTSFVGTTVQPQIRVDVNVAAVTRLFIDRTASNKFTFGYVTNAGETIVGTFTNGSAGLGSAVGLWSDCRGTAEPLARLDNLQIVPEPGALVAIVAGGLALLVARRRVV
jgi:hypothetical protein